MFTTAQAFILNTVMMLLELMERGSHALLGVAHGSGACHNIPLKAASQRLETTMFGYGLIGTLVVICLIIYIVKRV
jgi:hypothetical protein